MFEDQVNFKSPLPPFAKGGFVLKYIFPISYPIRLKIPATPAPPFAKGD